MPSPRSHRRILSQAHALLLAALVCAGAAAGEPEKQELKFGFIKLTDCAPLVVAYEKGYFEDEGLYVTLEAQANWKLVMDRVIDGSLDGAHMLPGQVLGAAVGFGTQAALIAPVAMGVNTLAITVSHDVWTRMKKTVPVADGRPVHPIGAEHLEPAVTGSREAGREFAMGMVFPTSTHNYLLRYWLAAGGLHPGYYGPNDGTGQTDAEVLLSVTPPPQMPATLESGTIAGFSVGEPWNQQAVRRKIGVAVVTANEIWARTPEKVFGLREDFATKYPETTRAIVRALIRAVRWLDADGLANRAELVEILARPEYVGADAGVLAGPLQGRYEYAPGDERALPTGNRYFTDHASYPFPSDAVWFLTQMRRWGQIAEDKPDAWYAEVAQRVYRPDLYRAAAAGLADAMADGLLPPADAPSAPPAAFIDGIEFDPARPNAYLGRFAIGRKPAPSTGPAAAASQPSTP